MLNNRYIRKKKLGEGSFAKVYLVEDIKSDCVNKAIKQFKLIENKESIEKEELLKEAFKIAQEAVILAKLDHPYITKYYDNFYTDGRFNIVMEYCEGGTLENGIKLWKKKNEKVSEHQTIVWLEDMISALTYLHIEKNLIHKDIKPLNIFMSNGSLKLGDFGLAKQFESLSFKASSSGTLAYQSPELLNSKPFDCKSDIWALAVSFFEVCKFELPFKNVVQVLHDNPPDLREPYKSLDPIIKKMLEKEPKNRPDIIELHKLVLENKKRNKCLLKLKVVDPDKYPREIREARVDISSGYASVSSVGKLSPIISKSTKPGKKPSISLDSDGAAVPFSGSVRIVPEYINISPPTPKRPSSTTPPTAVLTANNNDSLSKQELIRTFSTEDLDDTDLNATIKSFDSDTTEFSAEALTLNGNFTSGSVHSVPNSPYSSTNTPKFKRCTVFLTPDYKGFGFTSNSQLKPKYVINVDENSPAELAGLRKNDVIIEVNNKNIRRTSFDKVRMMLSDSYNRGKVELLVISKEGYLWFKSRKKRFSQKLATEYNVELFSNIDSASGQQVPSLEIDLPRLIPSKLKNYHIKRNQEYFGFGIILHTDKDKDQENDNILMYPRLEIEKNSPAAASGLQTGQRLVAVNNKFINKDFEAINSLAQAIDDSYYQNGSIDFLVIDEAVYENIKGEPSLLNNLANVSVIEVPVRPTVTPQINTISSIKDSPLIDPSLAQSDKIIPRFCRLQRNSHEDQYGFDFKTLKSEGKHIATNVRDGYPAQKAGLKNGDYIIEVNGRSIEGIEHEAVVNLIFSNVKQVDLLVVEDLKGYKKALEEQDNKQMQQNTNIKKSQEEESNVI